MQTVRRSFDADEEHYQVFKSWCVANKVDMTEKLNQLIRRHLLEVKAIKPGHGKK